jgi:hypothetical protein
LHSTVTADELNLRTLVSDLEGGAQNDQRFRLRPQGCGILLPVQGEAGHGQPDPAHQNRVLSPREAVRTSEHSEPDKEELNRSSNYTKNCCFRFTQPWTKEKNFCLSLTKCVFFVKFECNKFRCLIVFCLAHFFTLAIGKRGDRM